MSTEPPRLALVTGASRGLGETLSRVLADERFELIVTARHTPELKRTADTLRRTGARVTERSGDVADPHHRDELARAVAERPLHLLVNNASELGPSPLPSLAEYPLDALEHVLRVNTLAPLGLLQRLLPALAGGKGLVVNISSDAALGGYPGWGGYGASKAALDLFSLTLAHELEERGVSVVSVDPGDLRTAMHQAAYPGQDISDRPSPEVTRPFWVWLLHQDPRSVSGRRFRAQGDRWEAA